MRGFFLKVRANLLGCLCILEKKIRSVRSSRIEKEIRNAMIESNSNCLHIPVESGQDVVQI